MSLQSALLLALLLGAAAPEGELERLQKQEYERHHERGAAITRELAGLREHAWAASYGRGNGMALESIGLAPGAGAAFSSPGCMGLLTLNHGEIRASGPDWVEVAWKIDPALDTIDYLGKRRARLSPKLLLIPWDKERFLVPEARAMEFVNAVNAREVALVSRFWKRGETQIFGFPKIPMGNPVLPEALRPCLLENPVLCHCTKVRELSEPAAKGEPHLWREVEIDAGAAQKLRVGMCLFAGAKEVAGEVVEVRPGTARVEFRSFETNSQRTSLEVGTELSTRPARP